MAIFDPKRRMDKLVEKGLFKLGNDASQAGMISQLDGLKDFGDQAFTDRGLTLLCTSEHTISLTESGAQASDGAAGHYPSIGLPCPISRVAARHAASP